MPSCWKIRILLKKSSRFLQLLKSVRLQTLDTLVSFDAVSLFTNIPVDEAFQFVKNKPRNENTLAKQSVLKFEAFMELLAVFLRNTYFQVDGKFFQQKMAWLWKAFFHLLLATIASRILRN
jgi:hypothetical protein